MNLVTLKYPENKTSHPFDMCSKDNYFAESSGYSYLGSYEDFKKITPFDERSDKMKGAYVLDILKRHSIFDSGEKVWENQDFNDGINSEERNNNIYRIYSDIPIQYFVPSWNSYLNTFAILNNDGEDISFYGHNWGSLNEALLVAEEFSKTYQVKCIVCKLINSVNRY